MEFKPAKHYHIFNQGNNRKRLFENNPEDYLIFLRLMRKHLLPHMEIVAYCLMPNHFHMMIKTDERCLFKKRIGMIEMNPISQGLQRLLSGYSRVVNKRNGDSGSLFRQRSQAKILDEDEVLLTSGKLWQKRYLNCFLYIHNNPLKANLVNDLSLWPYSSYLEYAGLRKGTLVNRDLAIEIGVFEPEVFASKCIEFIPELSFESFNEL